MKKIQISLFVVSGLIATNANSSFVLAATDAAQTDVDATFVAGDRPESIKPIEGPDLNPTPVDPDLDPTDSNKPKPLPEAGNVYVMHLPNISFGSNKTDIRTTEYEALTEKRTRNSGQDIFYMPHSVQVADVSGNDQTKWKLSVQQDEVFKTADTNPATLSNTRMRIYGNTLTSTVYAAKDLVGKVDGVAINQSDSNFGLYAEIPVVGDTAGDLTVLNNKTAGYTVNSSTSSIFETGYLATNYDETKTPTAEKYDGVKLNVPASDKSQAKEYKAKLTWTLTVEP